MILFALALGLLVPIDRNVYLQRDGVYAIKSDTDTFSEEKLIQYLEELNMPFAEIIVAQARIESGNYSSFLFKEQHNIFSMKEANRRPTTAIGSDNGHAVYRSWRDAVIDYSLWYSRYASSCVTEDQYLNYLGRVYAEDKDYIQKLNKLQWKQ